VLTNFLSGVAVTRNFPLSRPIFFSTECPWSEVYQPVTLRETLWSNRGRLQVCNGATLAFFLISFSVFLTLVSSNTKHEHFFLKHERLKCEEQRKRTLCGILYGKYHCRCFTKRSGGSSFGSMREATMMRCTKEDLVRRTFSGTLERERRE